MRPVNLILIGLALAISVHAQAVTITNLTTNTVVFHDDFESGSFASPSAGTWTIPSDVTVTNSTTPPNPGPFEGSFYARSFRDTQFVSGQGNMFANLSAAQTNPGDVIHMSAMLYVPDDGSNARAFFALDDGNAGTDGRAIVRSDGADNVIALGPGLASVDTGLDYTATRGSGGSWSTPLGGTTFGVRVNGVSAGPFASFTAGQVDTGEIFNGAFNPAGSIFVDAVPESSPDVDYNRDSTIDAADYVVWRKIDGTQNGYNTWRANFGATSLGSGAGGESLSNATVPEPATIGLFVFGLYFSLILFRSPKRNRHPT